MLQEPMTFPPMPRLLDGQVHDRPMSAFTLEFPQGAGSADGIQDVEMPDAGPSTAPLQRSGPTFFHDE